MPRPWPVCLGASPGELSYGYRTIMGHRQRRNGILYNDLYRGRILFNRQSFRKDPDSRKRVSRVNDASELVSAEVPELRIIDEDTWTATANMLSRYASHMPQQSRRPKRLLSA